MQKYTKRIDWQKAPDVKRRVNFLIKEINLDRLKNTKIICFRSTNANTPAIARIWGLSKIWQLALEEKPAYILEVISEKFDRLNQKDQDKVLLHEFVHIPKNSSGSLLPHIRSGKRSFHGKLKKLYESYHTARRLYS